MENKKDIVVKHEGKAQLFKTPLLEILTKTSPFLHIVSYGSLVGLFFYLAVQQSDESLWLTQLLVFVSGIFFWTLFEYLMHRYLFHIAGDHKTLKRMSYLLHGVHHEYPKDEERVFMPPLPGFIISGSLFFMFYIFLQQYTYLFMAAVLIGYLVYSLMHYGMHHINPPRLLKRLWLHHALHHYQHKDKAFGVSSAFWDRVFGSMPPIKKNK